MTVKEVIAATMLKAEKEQEFLRKTLQRQQQKKTGSEKPEEQPKVKKQEG